MYNSLSAGAVDAVMDDQPVIQYAIQKGQDLAINMDGEAVGGFAFGVKKVEIMKSWSLNLTRPSLKWKLMEHLMRSSRNGPVKANQLLTVLFQQQLPCWTKSNS